MTTLVPGTVAKYANLNPRPVDLPPVVTANLLRPTPLVMPSQTFARNAKKRGGPNPCLWFALCDHPATGTTPHPTLGDVPTCDRCAAFAARS